MTKIRLDKLFLVIAMLAAPFAYAEESTFTDDLKGKPGVDLRLEQGIVDTPYGGIGRYQNFLKYSEGFDDAASGATWSETNLTVTASSANGPDGSTNTADTLTSSAANGYTEQSYDTGSALTARTFTFSVWLKTSSGTAVSRLKVLSSNTTPGNATASVTTSWQRFSVSGTFATDAATSLKAQIIPVDAGTGAVIAWGAQLEEAGSCRVYVKTGAAASATEGSGIVSNNAFTPSSIALSGGAISDLSDSSVDISDDLTISGVLKVNGADTSYFTGNIGIGTNSPLAALAVGNNLFKVNSSGAVTAGTWTGTDIAVADGGTGASTDSTARTNLGLAIGTNVQAYDADLDDLADGSLTGSKVGTGIDAANITTGTLSTDVYNALTDLGGGTGATFLRKDGTWQDVVTWTVSGSDVYRSSGNVGIGTTNPAAMLDVNGEGKFGNTSLACSAGTKGAIRYNSSSNLFEGCDGTSWKVLSMGDVTPLTFSFTDENYILLSTLTESNILQIVGINTSATVSISGQGTPQFRTCNDASCSTVLQDWTPNNSTIVNGKYLQLRLTSSGSIITAYSATVNVGTASDTWSVTTGDNVPDAFTFTDATNVELNTVTVSNILQLTGITMASPISISGSGSPQFRICSDASCASATQDWASSSSNIVSTDFIQLRLTSSSSSAGLTATTATVTVGGVSDNWSVTTGDTSADTFTFTNATGAFPSVRTYSSNILLISGITVASPVTMSGSGSPQFRICNDASCASVVYGWGTSSTITNNKYLQISLEAPLAWSQSYTDTVNVGGTSSSWTVTTSAPITLAPFVAGYNSVSPLPGQSNPCEYGIYCETVTLNGSVDTCTDVRLTRLASWSNPSVKLISRIATFAADSAKYIGFTHGYASCTVTDEGVAYQGYHQIAKGAWSSQPNGYAVGSTTPLSCNWDSSSQMTLYDGNSGCWSFGSAPASCVTAPSGYLNECVNSGSSDRKRNLQCTRP